MEAIGRQEDVSFREHQTDGINCEGDYVFFSVWVVHFFGGLRGNNGVPNTFFGGMNGI